jgi:hypothetical protein
MLNNKNIKPCQFSIYYYLKKSRNRGCNKELKKYLKETNALIELLAKIVLFLIFIIITFH